MILNANVLPAPGRAPMTGTLWLVATPIGHLDDFPPRAIAVLRDCAAVACEDTRHSLPLLRRHGIERPLLAYHEHNEGEQAPRVVDRLRSGESIALISDAGTPLISDPGYRLVAAAHAAGVPVRAVPGPCAAVVALSLSGLPTDRFAFEGFLPAKSAARRARLETLAGEARTLVFYESKHRIAETLTALAEVFGSDRRACLARELTKLHETVLVDALGALAARVARDTDQQLGEMVIVVEGEAGSDEASALQEGRRVYRILREQLPASRAAALAAQITGASRKALYGGDDG